MNNRLVPLIERILLRKRAVILLGGLIAYTYHPVKPSLDLEDKGLPALPPAIF